MKYYILSTLLTLIAIASLVYVLNGCRDADIKYIQFLADNNCKYVSVKVSSRSTATHLECDEGLIIMPRIVLFSE